MEIIGIIAGISGEVIRKELENKGYKTCVISGRKDDVGMEKSDLYLAEDLRKKENILKFLQKNNISKLILGTGHILAFELAEYLNKNGIKISINPEKSLLAKDKYLYKEKLEELGFLTPKFIKLKKDEALNIEKINKLKFPVVIKSTIDTMYPQKISLKDEALKVIETIQKTDSDVLIEEYIEGIDTTIPVYSNKEETKAIIVSYYSKAKECKLKGFLFEGSNEKKLTKEIEKKLMNFSEEVVKKTGTIGMVRLDIIVDSDNNFYILECNSVMVTGIHPNQIEYGTEFLQKENVNFAKYTVENALKIFNQEIL